MRRLISALLTASATAIVTAGLGAQQAKAKPKEGGGQIAGIAPSQPVVAVPGTSLVLTAPATPNSPPVVLLPDGRLFANFGRGYEQVAQQCGFSPYIDYGDGAYGAPAAPSALPPQPPPQVSGAVQPTVAQPAVAQPNAGPVLPIVSVPIIPSPAVSMSALPTQVTTLGQPVINPSACWARDRRGRIIVAVP